VQAWQIAGLGPRIARLCCCKCGQRDRRGWAPRPGQLAGEFHFTGNVLSLHTCAARLIGARCFSATTHDRLVVLAAMLANKQCVRRAGARQARAPRASRSRKVAVSVRATLAASRGEPGGPGGLIGGGRGRALTPARPATTEAKAQLFQYDGPLSEVDPEVAAIVSNEKNRQVCCRHSFRRRLRSQGPPAAPTAGHGWQRGAARQPGGRAGPGSPPDVWARSDAWPPMRAAPPPCCSIPAWSSLPPRTSPAAR